METSRSKFYKYLKEQKYASSTTELYTNAIELLTKKINKHLPKYKIGSLYNIKDINVLNSIYNELFSIDEITREESRGNYKNTNAFKRYLNFIDESFESVKENTKVESSFLFTFEDYIETKTEGGEIAVTSVLAERDASLRKIAINIHGLNCLSCGFNFEKTYGDYGKGFIEIHHIVKLRNETAFVEVKTNPNSDLIPLCSNCHSIDHRKKDITLTLDELKLILQKNIC